MSIIILNLHSIFLEVTCKNFPFTDNCPHLSFNSTTFSVIFITKMCHMIDVFHTYPYIPVSSPLTSKFTDQFITVNKKQLHFIGNTL